MKTKICLSLTEKTLSEDLKIFNKHKDEVDILELRVDCLSKDELFNVHTFPSLVDLPVILTVRREKDGGNFTYNEVARTMLFSLALNFTDSDIKKFAFVDLESDFFAPRLEYACKMYGIRICCVFFLISNEKLYDFKNTKYPAKKKNKGTATIVIESEILYINDIP